MNQACLFDFGLVWVILRTILFKNLSDLILSSVDVFECNLNIVLVHLLSLSLVHCGLF